MKYNPIVKEKLTQLENKIKQTRMLNDDVNLVEEVIPGASIWLDQEVNVYWSTKSMDEVKEVLAKFAKRRIFLEEFVKSDSTPTWYLKGRNARIRICPQWSTEEGTACRLVKTGETISAYPIYKLVCDGKEVGEKDVNLS